jgi:hypothetical protein
MILEKNVDIEGYRRSLASLTCQDEVHSCRLVERVNPSMNCASLNTHIPSFHRDHNIVVQVAMQDRSV